MLSGPNHEQVYLDGEFKGSTEVTHRIRLGEARTDDEAHLVVLAGYGDSRCLLKAEDPYPLIMDDFNSPDWVDDTCDGWITVSATHEHAENP